MNQVHNRNTLLGNNQDKRQGLFAESFCSRGARECGKTSQNFYFFHKNISEGSIDKTIRYIDFYNMLLYNKQY